MVFWLKGLESTDSELLFISQNVLRKVQHQDALQISDVVMASLLRMFQSTAGSGGVQEDALMAVSTLVEGQWAKIGQGVSLERKSINGHEEFLTAKKHSPVFSLIGVLSQFRAGLNISVNLCITALPLSLKWMGSQFATQIGNLSGGGGNCYLPQIHQVLLSPKVYLLYWGLAPVKHGGSKGFYFLSWHLVPSGLGYNALDSGWRNMVPGMEWNETSSSRN